MKDLSTGKIQDWIEWETEEGIHSPDRVEQGEDREDHLIYSFDRLEKELEEAAEIAEVFEAFQARNEIDERQLEYTNEIDREYDSLEHQIKDEIGYELADVSLFILKAATVLDNNSSVQKTAETLSGLFESKKETGAYSYREALSNLQREFDPEMEDSLAQKAPLNFEGENKLSWILEETASYLNGVSEGLPRDLSVYIEEKIDYNQDREIERMDASFETREKWEKLLDT